MQYGEIKFFNTTKGFGFITNDKGEDTFVHISGLKEEVKQGDRVKFNTEKGKKGICAIDVQLA